MNALLALTLEIPDWLFSGQYWGGFFTAVGLCFALLFYALSKFDPYS